MSGRFVSVTLHQPHVMPSILLCFEWTTVTALTRCPVAVRLAVEDWYVWRGGHDPGWSAA